MEIRTSKKPVMSLSELRANRNGCTQVDAADVNTFKIISTVFSTRDYHIFKTLDGNRDVNPLHIKRLKDSISKKYLINPIIVNEKYEIIDGQHRFEAAKELGLDVVFIVCQGYSLTDVQLLNTHAKNWSKLDYLDAYCKIKLEPYLQFKNFMDEFPAFGIASSEAIITLNLGRKQANDGKQFGVSSGKYAVKYFEEGNLEIPDIKYSHSCAEKIMQVAPYYKGFNRSNFVRAMLGIFKLSHYDHNQMISRIKSNQSMMKDCANVTQYKEMLEEIYNFRSREKVSLKF